MRYLKVILLIAFMVMVVAQVPLLRVVDVRNRIAVCAAKSLVKKSAAGICDSELATLLTMPAVPMASKVRFSLQLGKRDAGLALADAGSQVDYDGETRYLLARAYVDAQQFEKARRLIESLSIPSSLAVELALEAFQSKQWDQFRFWTEIADTRRNQDWISRQWLGFLWLNLNDPAKALFYLEPVHQEMPDAVYPMWLLSIIYENTDINRSVELLQRAIVLDPNYLTTWYQLTKAYLTRGAPGDLEKAQVTRNKAIILLEEYLQRDPNDVNMQAWLTELENLRIDK